MLRTYTEISQPQSGAMPQVGVDAALELEGGSEAWVDKVAGGGVKRVKVFYFENPGASDDLLVLASGSKAITIGKVWGTTNTGTVTFQLKSRAITAPGTGGTNILTSSMDADSDGENTTDFAAAGVPANYVVQYVSSAVTSSPGKLWLVVEYTVD